jgi:nicotinate-nucleotide adenylyltransferase
VARARIGLLGGTFDPIHIGHLALARAAQQALLLDEVRFIPTGRSWQKRGEAADGAHRLAMTRLAVGNTPGWQVDTRELDREGATYTVDTLRELRTELGPEPALVLLLGADQFHNLATWHRYQELLEHAHIAATARGPDRLAEFPPAVEALLDAHGRDALPDAPAGSIVFFRMPPVPVSATALRTALARGEPHADLLPAPVLDYIERHHLYQDRGAQG